LAQLVRERSGGRCEYCRLPQRATSVPFESDHIIARKHGGPTVASNIANVCWYCNSFKGSDIAGLDPLTGKLTRLFHPRRHSWAHHFRYDGPMLVGRTAIGRTTIRVLQTNCEEAVALRESLIAEGLFDAGPRGHS
jgi:HNH endonuclease